MKIHFWRSAKVRSIAIAALILWSFSMNVGACEFHNTTKEVTMKTIKDYFQKQNREVVTFVGYSGSEYEDKNAMLEQAESILEEFDASKTIINIGGTPEGIGAVYDLAKRKGFFTTGIVSTQAKEYEAALSPAVDRVFYVKDATWGGFMEGGDQLSPTSAAMVENSDILIGIGGGEVGRDELLAAKQSGKEIRFIPADMNHDKARAKAQKKGLSEPTSFSGAASEVFQ